MRPGQQNRRNRGRTPRRSNNNSRNFESNGPDVKIRGTANHVAEKYAVLARDAMASGSTVLAENYLQHAEHYNRIVQAMQAKREEAAASSNTTAGGASPKTQQQRRTPHGRRDKRSDQTARSDGAAQSQPAENGEDVEIAGSGDQPDLSLQAKNGKATPASSSVETKTAAKPKPKPRAQSRKPAKSKSEDIAVQAAPAMDGE